jgi:hypothetical protein
MKNFYYLCSKLLNEVEGFEIQFKNDFICTDKCYELTLLKLNEIKELLISMRKILEIN